MKYGDENEIIYPYKFLYLNFSSYSCSNLITVEGQNSFLFLKWTFLSESLMVDLINVWRSNKISHSQILEEI